MCVCVCVWGGGGGGGNSINRKTISFLELLKLMLIFRAITDFQ